VLWLVKNGVPFDVAFALSPDDVTAWAIIYSEFNLPKDKYFNFKTMSFPE